jgi:hypothetical protein
MTKTLAFLLSASLAACTAQAEVRYSGSTSDPELVAMETDPDVMVVSNADEPVFYSDHSYWLYRDHGWYRSGSYRGGWARVDQPPEHVRRIERPEVYVHYRHNANPPRTTANERERTLEPSRNEIHEDHRDQTPAPAHEPNPQGPDQPYANPRPPQQVPPEAGPRDRDDRPNHPDSDRGDHRRPDEPR